MRNTSQLKQLYFQTSGSWKNWLASNHDKENGVWLIFYKKNTGILSIDYEAAVDEALCYGWVDSIIKRIDDKKYVRKFTPRSENSRWSELNKKRVAKLLKANRMTEAGILKIEAAKRNGRWDSPGTPVIQFDMPEEFQSALNRNKKAKEHFNQLSATYQKQYIVWITVAKRPETRERRIKQSIDLLENGQKLGLK
jgi:uncharacterized protein YdeI (YjbR/CyaY-like superfamily)